MLCSKKINAKRDHQHRNAADEIDRVYDVVRRRDGKFKHEHQRLDRKRNDDRADKTHHRFVFAVIAMLAFSEHLLFKYRFN